MTTEPNAHEIEITAGHLCLTLRRQHDGFGVHLYEPYGSMHSSIGLRATMDEAAVRQLFQWLERHGPSPLPDER